MFDLSPDRPFDFTPPSTDDDRPPRVRESEGLVFDMDFRQVLFGDYVVLPSATSVVDRALVVAVHGSIVEFMILAADTGVPETLVLDMRRPDPHSGLFGRYGYVGVKVCARKDEPAALDFTRQLLAACEELKTSNPRFNPFLIAQANTRVQFLRSLLDIPSEA
jgi:hypothetical protein